MVKISLRAKGPTVRTYGLIDTGNKLHEGVAINEELARKLQLPIDPCDLTVGTAANDGDMSVIGRVYNISVILGDDCPSYIHEALVIPELRTPINLGCNWVEEIRGILDYSKPRQATLVVKQMKVPLVQSIDSEVENTSEDEERSGIPPGEHSPPSPQISHLKIFEDLNHEISSYTSALNVCKPTVKELCKNDDNFSNGNVHHSRDFFNLKPDPLNSYIEQISFKHKAKADFVRKNVWTRNVKGAQRSAQGQGVRLKTVALRKTPRPVRLSVQATRMLAGESVSVLNFLPSREIRPQMTVMVEEAMLGDRQDVRIVEGVYRAQQNGVLRIPVVNLHEEPCIAAAGCVFTAEICEDSSMVINTETLELREPSEVIQSMSENQKSDHDKPLTKEQMENPTFKEVWADLEMEDNELLKEHPDVKKQVKQLIWEYRDIFSREAPGHTDLVTMKLRLKPGTEPIRQRYRELNPKMLKDLEAQMADWLNQGVIEPSTSPWASPLVPVRKKDGKIRWAVDFRRLNSCLEQDSYPLPRIQTLLDRAGGHRVYSTLDATAAYFNISIDPASRELTAFATPTGLWQFRRMPFGISTAPAVYSRFISTAMNPLGSEIAQCYLDDVISYNMRVADHVPQMRQVFEAHRKAGIKLKAKKSKLFQKKIQYLGHMLSKEGIGMVPEYVERIKNWPSPNTVAELNSCLGFYGYYRSFIPEYAALTCEMNAQKKAAKLDWTPTMEENFQKLKDKFESAPIRAVPDFEADTPFQLTTDYSGKAIGAVLSQVQNGAERLIAAMGRKTTGAEQRYPSWKGEASAVIYGIRKFRTILSFKPFQINTDNSALKQLKSLKKNTGMMARWTEELAGFEFRVVHRPGKLNTNADALSRRTDADMPSPTAEEEAEQEEYIGAVGEENEDDPPQGPNEQRYRDRIYRHQLDDPILEKVRRWIGRDRRAPDRATLRGESRDVHRLAEMFDTLRIAEDGVLEQEIQTFTGKRRRILVPFSLREEVFNHSHRTTTGSHFGMHATISKFLRNFYYVGHQSDIRLRIAVCHDCVQKNIKANIKIGAHVPIQNGFPLQTVYMDLAGKFTTTPEGYNYILTLQDGWSRFVQAHPIRQKTAEEVATTIMDKYISTFGCPQAFHSDQGTEFCNAVMKILWKKLGVKHEVGPVANPQSNLVERWHRTMEETLRTVIQGQETEWPKYLPGVVLAYNTKVHSTTGVTPFLAFMGREATLPADLILRLPNPDDERDIPTAVRNLLDRYTTMYDAMAKSQETIIRRNASQYRNNREFRVGDKVFYLAPTSGKGAKKKMEKHWSGPFLITEKCAEVLYRIQTIPAGEAEDMVVHVGRLRPYYPPTRADGDPTSPPEPFEEDGDEAGEQIPLNLRRQAQPPNPRIDFSLNDDSDEEGGPPNVPGGAPPHPPPEVDPINFPLPVTPPPGSPQAVRTPRREQRERRERERDRSCEPSGSGLQRNDARRPTARERSPRESPQLSTPRREREREREIHVPRMEKRPLSDSEEQHTDSPEKGERAKSGGKKQRSGTLWQQQAEASAQVLDSSDDEMDPPRVATLSRTLRIPVKRGAKLPYKGTRESAGHDIYCPAHTILPPGQQTCIPLKLHTRVPPGYFIKLFGRSSIEREGVILLAGLVDSDYTGEIQAVFWNLSTEAIEFNKGQRVCQAVVLQTHDVEFYHVDNLPTTDRGANGFGSTN